jgi:hypothetical protein
MASTALRAAALVGAALLAPPAARSADYYLSPRGDDSGAGTRARPWRTLGRASAQRYLPGDRILLLGGESFEGGLVLGEPTLSDPERPITIGSWGDGRATIRAGKGDAVRVANLGGVEIRDLIVVGDGESNEGRGIFVLNERGRERLEHVRVEDVDASGFRWAGIYVGGPPTDLPGVEATGEARFGFRDVRITRCRARDNVYYGIHVSAHWRGAAAGYGNADVTIADSVAHDNPGDPDYAEGRSGTGILLDDTDGGTIERCVAFRNGARNGGTLGGAAGIATHASRRVLVQHCESWGNRTGGEADGGGFDLDGGTSESIVQYCYSHDNDGAGFLVREWGTHHPLTRDTVRYCISENDGRRHRYGGIHVGTSAEPILGLDVYHNTVYTTPAPDGEPRGIWAGGRPSEGLRFRNNAIVAGGGVPLVEVERTLSAPGAIVFEGNAWWALGGPFVVLDAGRIFASLPDWRAALGRERRGDRDLGLFADPGFARAGEGETIGDPARLDRLSSYRLLDDSPLVGAALPLRALGVVDPGSFDFWGTPLPRDRTLDVGACQHAR